MPQLEGEKEHSRKERAAEGKCQIPADLELCLHRAASKQPSTGHHNQSNFGCRPLQGAELEFRQVNFLLKQKVTI